MTKADFIAAMGGSSVPVGNGGATVGDMADTLEALVDHMTNPGSRVYDARQNQEKFWDDLVTMLNGGQ